MAILMQFVYRLSFGLAAAMALTSPRQVTSGYFRVHLYVVMGLNVLASMVALTTGGTFSLRPAAAAAITSYLGAVFWLYEKQRLGRMVLAVVAAIALAAAYQVTSMPADFGWPGGLLKKGDGHLAPGEFAEESPLGSKPVPVFQQAAWQALAWLDPLTGGLVLGTTIAAMFLGHWYLNTPTMQLAPLRRLVVLMGAAVVARAVVCGLGLAMHVATAGAPDTAHVSFLALRWLSGLLGSLALAWMTWQTLKIPNTQSATGILYVAVIATFLGELTSLLLSRGSMFPL